MPQCTGKRGFPEDCQACRHALFKMKIKREYTVIANEEARIDKQFLHTIISCARCSRLLALFTHHDAGSPVILSY